MKIYEILDQTEIYEYELRMSGYAEDYIRENPHLSHKGETYYDNHAVCFQIDWESRTKSYVNDLLKYSKDLEIVSWDEDDGNIIYFNKLLVDHNNKLAILI